MNCCALCLLVVGVAHSIGEESYVALPKGGVDDNHVLIVPITHQLNTVVAPPAVVKEMGVFALALRKCYAAQGLTTVLFERAVRTRGAAHTHYQVFGVKVCQLCWVWVWVWMCV